MPILVAMTALGADTDERQAHGRRYFLVHARRSWLAHFGRPAMTDGDGRCADARRTGRRRAPDGKRRRRRRLRAGSSTTPCRRRSRSATSRASGSRRHQTRSSVTRSRSPAPAALRRRARSSCRDWACRPGQRPRRARDDAGRAPSPTRHLQRLRPRANRSRPASGALLLTPRRRCSQIPYRASADPMNVRGHADRGRSPADSVLLQRLRDADHLRPHDGYDARRAGRAAGDRDLDRGVQHLVLRREPLDSTNVGGPHPHDSLTGNSVLEQRRRRPDPGWEHPRRPEHPFFDRDSSGPTALRP